jgi:hypothetical protein
LTQRGNRIGILIVLNAESCRDFSQLSECGDGKTFSHFAADGPENPNIEARRNAGEGAAGLSNPKQI